jgi:RNA polymerase sigma-70 factor, ECF subfamily
MQGRLSAGPFLLYLRGGTAVGINSGRDGMKRAWGNVPDQTSWQTFEAEAMPHVDRLFRLALWLERNRAEAEDLVQETLTQALQSFHRYTPGTNCRAWLITILQHVRANRRRARGRAPLDFGIEERVANTIPFVPPIPEMLTDEDLLAALDSIPAQYHEVILLCDVQEMTYKEIAAALDIPIGTVMSRLHRGRELLRVALASRGTGRAAAREVR